MALRKEKLESFRKLLLTQRDAIAHEVTTATAQMIEDDEVFADSIDQASAEADRTLTLQFKNRDREILAQIKEALRRIEQGTFGECEQCGENIAEARMKANPATTLCIDCKAELESERGRFPGRVSL